MALLNGRGGLITGLAIGLGTGLLAAALAPGLGPAIRPKAKAAIKAGLIAAQRGRVALAELGETTEDLFAEAQSELMAEQNGGNGADREANRSMPAA